MTPAALTAFARDVALETRTFVAAYVAKALGGIPERLAALEQRPVLEGPAGRDGKDVDPELVKSLQAMIETLRGEVLQLKAAQSLVPTFVVDDDGQLVMQRPGEIKGLGRVRGKDGRDGALPDLDEIARKAASLIAVPKDGRDGRDGKDADPATIDAAVVVAVAKAMAAVPVPKDGAPGRDGVDGAPGRDGRDGTNGSSVTVSDVLPVITKELDQAIKALPSPKDGRDGRDGTSVTLADVAPIVAVAVEQAVAAIPLPKDGADGTDGRDGASITVEDVAPLVAAEVTKAMATVRVPADGVGLTGAVLDRAGHLILTLSDGGVKDVGNVAGKDADPADISRTVAEAIAKIPLPKDGRDGTDGRDGLGFDDLSVEHDEVGRSHLVFTRGDQVKRFRLSNETDRGVYRDGETYYEGNGVTENGSYWKAQKDLPTGKPGSPNSGWRLAVRKGSDGKGIKGAPGPRGPKGDAGPDAWGNS